MPYTSRPEYCSRWRFFAHCGLPAGLLAFTAACGRPAPRLPAAPAGNVGGLAADYLDTHGPKAELLLLGVFHFADPGLDGYKPRFSIDVKSAERQREIAGVVSLLERFQPTKIAVEWPASDQASADSLYRAYRSGDYQLGTNEVYQLGFRLARRLGHARVYAVDAPGRAPVTEDEARTQAASLGFNIDSALKADPWEPRYGLLYAYEDSLKTVTPLRNYLLYLNDPERIRIGHGHYLVGPFKLARRGNYVGVDDMSRWYNRNLRIFSNLQQLTDSPEERVLVIIGAGHLPILRFLAQTSPEHRLIEASAYLANR